MIRPIGISAIARRLRRDRSGVAFLEFALGLPLFLAVSLTGTEMTNYIITKMRLSQLALQVADNAARMGEGSLLAAKTISEADINDVFTGAELQARELDLYEHGRVILSSLQLSDEGKKKKGENGKYEIAWQRCQGKAKHNSSYGETGDRLEEGIGPEGREVTVLGDNATMFVEIYYEYQPLVSGSLAPSETIEEIASMAVRDRRDIETIDNKEKVKVSTCKA